MIHKNWNSLIKETKDRQASTDFVFKGLVRILTFVKVSRIEWNTIKESTLRNYRTHSDPVVGARAFAPVSIITEPTAKRFSTEYKTTPLFGSGVGDVFQCSSNAARLGRGQFTTCTDNECFGVSVPTQLRRTHVMSNFKPELVPRVVVSLIGFITRRIGVMILQLMPIPAFDASLAGPVGLFSRVDYTTFAPTLAMAAPNMRGGNNRQHVRGDHSGKSGSTNLTLVDGADKKAKRFSAGKDKEPARDRSKDWPNRQLWLDAVTFGYIQDLVDAVEANSASELIRRALHAREDFHFDTEELDETIAVLQSNKEDAKRLTVTLPPKSWERVERMKTATGKSFRTLVYEAITIFAELHMRSVEGKDDADEGGRVYLY